MALQTVSITELPRDLGNGLILRRSTRQDAEALAEFNSKIHSDDGPDKPDERVAAWTRDLLLVPHPTFNEGDFTIVEDTASRQVVSSMNLISQAWTYNGIPFKVGRPELVGTLPEYRNRGLVRAQFDVVHAWSAERGEMVQGITGIPYYYRLFGYEMALSLGGGRAGFKPHLPKLKEGESEPFNIRPALETDLGWISALYKESGKRYLIHCDWDEALLRYELKGKSPENVNRYELRVIESTGGERVGFLVHTFFNWGAMLVVNFYELMPGISWGDVTPTVVRYIYNTGKKLAEAEGKGDDFSGFGLWFGNDHPAYAVLHDSLPRVRKPYAWYIRVPDLPGFLQHIHPALEENLANSPYRGHTAELKVTFYKQGFKIKLDKGRITAVEAYHPAPVGHKGDAAFPGLTFLQLLFGYRSLDELLTAFPDCWTETNEAYGLLNDLFPKKDSDIWPVS